MQPDQAIYTEDDLLPISALQHLAFCERQCALIYVEGQWQENRLTVEGKHLHDRAHEPDVEMRSDVRLCRGLNLHCFRLGLVGKADLVEFHRVEPGPEVGSGATGPPGVALRGLTGRWQPYPVEYKRGKPKPDICDEVQLCAQALCLEEMLQTSVPWGALYYGQPRRRQEVALDASLRVETERLALRLRALVIDGETPLARYEKKCRNCSLLDVCMPECADGRHSARRYLARALQEVLTEEGGQPDETTA
jgi:CRISPR-associated exonuclease Cas4